MRQTIIAACVALAVGGIGGWLAGSDSGFKRGIAAGIAAEYESNEPTRRVVAAISSHLLTQIESDKEDGAYRTAFTPNTVATLKRLSVADKN